MSQTRAQQQPRVVLPPAAPAHPHTTPTRPAPAPVPVSTAAPDWPSRWQLLIPVGLRDLAQTWGLWQGPIPLKPSDHLTQVLAVLERYGWAQSFDFSPTGRMCIRGAQTFLERTGHVTRASRARAVDYMQHHLRMNGVTMPFHAWNDLPDRTFPQVRALITHAANSARKNGE